MTIGAESEVVELADLQRRLELIEGRNVRVEAEKAWEGSWFRRFLIMGFTYVIVAAYNAAIGNDKVFLTALVPVTGFFLSTLTFRWIRTRYVNRRISRR